MFIYNILFNDFIQSENIDDTTKVEEQGKASPNWPKESGVCAAASPGGAGQRRKAFLSAREQVGDPIAKIKIPG
jgi:hypothetical protein